MNSHQVVSVAVTTGLGFATRNYLGALTILGHIQTLHKYSPDEVEGLEQATATPIETTLV